MSRTYTASRPYTSAYNPFAPVEFDGYTGLNSVYYPTKYRQKRFVPGPSVRRSFKRKRVPPKKKMRKIKAYRKKKVFRRLKRKNWIRATANMQPWIVKNDTFASVHSNPSGAVGIGDCCSAGLNLNYPGEPNPSIAVPCSAAPEVGSNTYYSDIRSTLISMDYDPDEDDTTSALLQIDYIKHFGEIRNNSNIACTMRFYRLTPRERLNYGVTRDTFTEIIKEGLVEQGNSSLVESLPISWTPFDSNWITKNWIIKGWTRRLLPGEKCFYSYKVPIPKINNLSKLTKTGFQKYSGVIGFLINGDPAHNSTATIASSAPTHVDIIHKVKRKFRKYSTNLYNRTNNNDALPALDKAVFNSAFANEPSEFDTTVP